MTKLMSYRDSRNGENKNIEGFYHKIGNTFQNETTTLVVGTRQNATIRKPAKYLLQRFSDRSHKYISSLYPTSSTTYSLDYQGVNYIATMTANDLIISSGSDHVPSKVLV